MKKFFLVFTTCVLSLPVLLAQQPYIDPNKGNIAYTKKGIMDGNNVRTIFFNHGEVTHWPDQPSGEWPKGTGHTYVDGISIIVQAETQDTAGTFIHPLETNYREFIRKDPVTLIPWGWEPLPGYASSEQDPSRDQPAMSNNPSTWPKFWPDLPKWDGYWNGFFGPSIQNADLETYFRMDDAADQGYPLYRPDPSDTTRGGLGLQVSVRGFQWSQVLASDVIFWYYEITNIAKQDYTKTLYAQYVDWGIGGLTTVDDDSGTFDKELDIAYAWDRKGIGQPGNWSPVGVAGYAFLESPGIATNNLDDDLDGIINESRNNDAGTKIVGRDNILAYITTTYNMKNFMRFYNYGTFDDIPAIQQGYFWTGDENANWRGFTDLNKNGKWDPGESLNDDVGSDGLGPNDDAYPGPDADGSEADGKPEQSQFGCEQNFGKLDKDESDQIGLTGFSIFPVHYYGLLDDEKNWSVLSEPVDPSKPVQQQLDVNLGMFFSAGARRVGSLGNNLFPLKQGQTERFSMALLFGMDRDDLSRRKRTVQQIYNANYRFAKPPDKPILTAVPGNKRVTLYWDDKAERSWDPFLQKRDFEGYRIYRSTESAFLENLIITDAYGKSTFRKPIAQYDLVDSIKGLHPIDVNGVKFDLGNDTGLRHIYVDTLVQNGQTYYYAVVSYDYGFTTTTVTGKLDGIAPSECASIIRADINGNIIADVNTAVVVPRAPAAGYSAAGLDGAMLHLGPGSGNIQINILNPDSVKDGHIYRITFQNTSAFQINPIPTFTLTDETTNRIFIESKKVIAKGEETLVFDGMLGYVFNDATVEIDQKKTQWVNGSPNVIPRVNNLEEDLGYKTNAIRYPADYEIRFFDRVVDTSVVVSFFDIATPTSFTVWNVTENKKANFIFIETIADSLLSIEDRIIITFGDSLGKPLQQGNYHFGWNIQFYRDTTKGTLQMPGPGDVLRIVTTKPFRTGEAFQFKMKAGRQNNDSAKVQMGRIAVVPNPYVGAASWEPPNQFRAGRGERRIFFVNLPAQCTIRIYTVRGSLVHTLIHSTTADNGQEPWNLVSKDGMDISFGIYIFQVDAPSIGEKIGRFAIIK